MKQSINKLLISTCGVAIMLLLLSQTLMNPVGVFNACIWVAAISFVLALATA